MTPIPPPRTSIFLQNIPNAGEELADALDAMAEALDHSFGAEGKAPSLKIVQRDRLVQALRAVGTFFETIDWLGNDGTQFFYLATALSDLDRGSVHPLLARNKTGNKSPDPSEVWMVRARVAFAFELLMRGGQTRRAAAKYIAKNYPSLSAIVNRSQSLEGAIKSWRDQFIGRKVKNRPASENFAFDMVFLESNLKNNIWLREIKEALREEIGGTIVFENFKGKKKKNFKIWAQSRLKNAVDYCHRVKAPSVSEG